MKLKWLFLILVIGCATQREMSPEDLPSCDDAIVVHLENYKYIDIIKALPKYDNNRASYCSVNKKIKVSQDHLKDILDEVSAQSVDCDNRLNNPLKFYCENKDKQRAASPLCENDKLYKDNDTLKTFDVDRIEDEKRYTYESIINDIKRSREECGADSEFNDLLRTLKSITGIDFIFETEKYEIIVNEQLKIYGVKLEENKIAADQRDKLKQEENSKNSKKVIPGNLLMVNSPYPPYRCISMDEKVLKELEKQAGPCQNRALKNGSFEYICKGAKYNTIYAIVKKDKSLKSFASANQKCNEALTALRKKAAFKKASEGNDW